MAKNLAELYDRNLKTLESQAKRNNVKETNIGKAMQKLEERKNAYLAQYEEDKAGLMSELEELRQDGDRITGEIQELKADMED